ncbi:hypothetical protein [Priestia koreensis]|uniref:hypothetical protein n=1 Tax=Priestia koreensis TaxID=284581 RepID=UPI00203B8492|nr:hypothetical protein [Priestia koreensis]MCM3006883.1 hypothetical protein [Priestia koreensis]
MKYDIKIYEDDQGSLRIDVPDEIYLVDILLLSDVQQDGTKTWINLVDKVLSKESTYEEITGNVCTMQVKNDTTKIVFEYALEGGRDHCFIETDELKKIFLLWDQAIEKKYRESN